MTAPAVVEELRRLSGEYPPESSNYSDEYLLSVLTGEAVADELGQPPYLYDYTKTPPLKYVNPAWLETYDINAAVGKIWAEKAAVVAQDFNFSADGSSLSRSQQHEHYMEQARFYASRRAARSCKIVSIVRQTINHETTNR